MLLFTVLKADEKSMNKILVCGCMESSCLVNASKSMRLASSVPRFVLWANWSGSSLSNSSPNSWSHTGLSMHLQRIGVGATRL